MDRAESNPIVPKETDDACNPGNPENSEIAPLETPKTENTQQDVGDSIVLIDEKDPRQNEKSLENSKETSIFGISNIWGAKITNSLTLESIFSQVKKGSEEFAKDCQDDLADISSFLKTGVDIASKGINKGYLQLKTNVQQELEDIKAEKGTPIENEIQVDERGIPIVADEKDFEKVQESISDTTDLINSKAASGIEAISNMARRISEPSTKDPNNTDSQTGLGDYFNKSSMEFGSILQGIKGNFNKASIDLQKQKLSSIVQKIGSDLDEFAKKAISITGPENQNSETDTATGSQSLMEKHKNSLLSELQANENTFLVDPSQIVELQNTQSQINYPMSLQGQDVINLYNDFLKEFEYDSKTSQSLLDYSKEMKNQFKVLVPTQISEVEFWTRYNFRVWQFDYENERKKKLVRELESTSNDDDFDWDMDDDEKESNSIEIIQVEEVNGKASENGSAETKAPKGSEKNKKNKQVENSNEKKNEGDESDSWE
ncbi:hypothetical protein AYI68_g6159 [Smittium mucronatum]|uniref:BSD domain-containing protein n=1 Tax=Smittium mucronatum TaxID=133383 RepID=A0A1R0GRZ1_9FUNG|nr:hypothetical protein AYI68_g6280 [Smittium mucronatum]OLY79764.1 hypothetical protein AYI68_g6159 [Smittium mucronatum]